MTDDPFVTIITPTIGRPQLKRACSSLLSQSDQDFESIIVPDPRHVMVMRDLPDSRFLYVEAPENASGSAGLLRNAGIEAARGRWIGFLDDDDRLTYRYVQHLKEHAARFPTADVIVFRMNDEKLGILPEYDNPHIEQGHVGISYAIRSVWLHGAGFRFVKENVAKRRHEDYQLLADLEEARAEFYISPFVDYLVRNAPAVADPIAA